MSKQGKTKVDEKDPLAGDLAEFIGKANWRKVRFVMAPKNTTVTIRINKGVVDLAKKVAKQEGVKYHRLMRNAITSYVIKAA
jgi:predicted DNA binding CopG/RHH family protein